MTGIVSSSGPMSPHRGLQEPTGQRPDFQGTKCNYRKLCPESVCAAWGQPSLPVDGPCTYVPVNGALCTQRDWPVSL